MMLLILADGTRGRAAMVAKYCLAKYEQIAYAALPSPAVLARILRAFSARMRHRRRRDAPVAGCRRRRAGRAGLYAGAPWD
jgi:hypothetical protein